jgi:hypothetical protein
MTPTFCENDAVREAQDAGRAVWVAGLSDGSRVFQDDADGEWGAWPRLADYLRATGLAIVSLSLKFRSQWLRAAPENAPGYYVSRGVMGVVGGEMGAFVAVGWVHGDRLRVLRVHVPELLVFCEEDRDIPTDDPRLILAYGTPQDRTGRLHPG